MAELRIHVFVRYGASKISRTLCVHVAILWVLAVNEKAFHSITAVLSQTKILSDFIKLSDCYQIFKIATCALYSMLTAKITKI